MLAYLSPHLHRYGFTIESDSPDGVMFGRRYTPRLVILFVVFLFPIGLVLLLLRRREALMFTLLPHEPGSKLVITGSAPRSLRRWLQQLTV